MASPRTRTLDEARQGSVALRLASCIGPHTVTQVAEVMRDRMSDTFAEAVLRDATKYTLASLPRAAMIDEREPQALVRALVYRLGAHGATTVMREAGERTSMHLLEHGIPFPLQVATRLAPKPLALRLLLARMRANAWNFAGSGHFSVMPALPRPQLIFTDCAMCRGLHESQPMCAFYAGAFQYVFGRLIAREARVTEIECIAQGDSSCRFELTGV